MNISGPAAVAKPEMLFYAPGDLTVTKKKLSMADIIHLNQEEIKSQLGDMVRKSVEDTLNAMLDAEAD